MKYQYLISILITLNLCVIIAQERDTLSQVSQINLGTANDLFQQRQKSDKYFSASFSGNVYHEVLNNNAARKVLFASSEENNSFSLGLRQNGFTPEDLTTSEIDSSDRPYAGTLTLNYSQTSQLLNHNIKYNTAIKIGFSGPLAMVKGVQTNIHENTGSPLPQGWHNQIANSLIVQYAALGEKEFLSHLPHLRVGLGGYGEVGSFYNYVMAYGTIKVGWFHQDYLTFTNVQYRSNSTMGKWQLYLSLFVSDRLVLYDGSLQGGLIPFGESPYTLSWSDYRHNTVQASFALTASYKNFQIKYWNIMDLNRFATDEIFAFGAIGLYIPFGK